jgi:hypothetical protein
MMTVAELHTAIKGYLDLPNPADADMDAWIDITTEF